MPINQNNQQSKNNKQSTKTINEDSKGHSVFVDTPLASVL